MFVITTMVIVIIGRLPGVTTGQGRELEIRVVIKQSSEIRVNDQNSE